MKRYLYLPMILLMSVAAVAAPKKEVKTCKDCGCSGPDKTMCPSEKGKKCSCPKT